MKLSLFVQLTRPKTLIASVAPVLLTYGTCINGGLVTIRSTFLFLLTLSTAILLQVLANFLNDYYDLLSGVDKGRSKYAPPRLLLTGHISLGALKRYIRYLLCLVVISGGILVWHSNVWILVVGLASILVAALYSYGKRSLASLGLGEVVTILFFGFIPTYGTALILAPRAISFAQLLPIALFCGVSSALILLANNLRDYASDLKNGKRTVVVRFGIGTNIKLFVSLVSFCLILFILQLPQSAPYILRLCLIGVYFWKLLSLVYGAFDVAETSDKREQLASRLLPLAGANYTLGVVLLFLIECW